MASHTKLSNGPRAVWDHVPGSGSQVHPKRADCVYRFLSQNQKCFRIQIRTKHCHPRFSEARLNDFSQIRKVSRHRVLRSHICMETYIYIYTCTCVHAHEGFNLIGRASESMIFKCSVATCRPNVMGQLAESFMFFPPDLVLNFKCLNPYGIMYQDCTRFDVFSF